MDNFILNWTNKCKHDDNAVVAGVTNMAVDLKSKGYKRAEAKDMLLSNDMNLDIVEAALNNVYIKKAKKTQEPVVARKLPTSYEDMQPFVSELLHKSTPKEFIDILTSGEKPIVSVGTKDIKSLTRLAEAAKESPSYEASLHNNVSLWLEEELLQSVEAAEKTKNVKVAAELKIDTKNLTCSCDKFVSRHYAELGLVCEHIINRHS